MCGFAVSVPPLIASENARLRMASSRVDLRVRGAGCVRSVRLRDRGLTLRDKRPDIRGRDGHHTATGKTRLQVETDPALHAVKRALAVDPVVVHDVGRGRLESQTAGQI